MIDDICCKFYYRLSMQNKLFICFVFVQIGVRWELSVKYNNENIIHFFLPLRERPLFIGSMERECARDIFSRKINCLLLPLWCHRF